MKLFKYRYVLYGKERHMDTGIHPISIHYTLLGAYISMIMHWRHYTKLSVA